jgi:hypothetical protein
MYNLFVIYDPEAWAGNPVELELSRCVREYTADELTSKYGELRAEDISTLMGFPCLFANEDSAGKNARVGRLTRIRKKGTTVRLEYEILPDAIRVTPAQLEKFSWDFGIGNWEMNRTHWALKEESLEEALHNAGIKVAPNLVPGFLIDLTQHVFDIALSFPGDQRPYVESVYRELSKDTRATIFYDAKFKSQLARPNLDNLLQEIYGTRSKLIVVFLGASYAKKEWCGIEFRVVREIIKAKNDAMVMYVRHDQGKVPGVLSTDGYFDALTHTPEEVAALIMERVRLNQLA